MTIDEITKLRAALASYDNFDARMGEELDELSKKAKKHNDYRYYDETRFDWLECAEDYAGFLADAIREVLKAYE